MEVLLFLNTIVHFDRYIVGWPVSGKASIRRSQWTIRCFRIQSCILAGGLLRDRVPEISAKRVKFVEDRSHWPWCLKRKVLCILTCMSTRRRVHETKKMSRQREGAECGRRRDSRAGKNIRGNSGRLCAALP